MKTQLLTRANRDELKTSESAGVCLCFLRVGARRAGRRSVLSPSRLASIRALSESAARGIGPCSIRVSGRRSVLSPSRRASVRALSESAGIGPCSLRVGWRRTVVGPCSLRVGGRRYVLSPSRRASVRALSESVGGDRGLRRPGQTCGRTASVAARRGVPAGK